MKTMAMLIAIGTLAHVALSAVETSRCLQMATLIPKQNTKN